ncbi:hypothetical protein [uncultured Mediterranean phage uvMED]|nr:hypothetical protein [uncultured Mediterranean phage uvMED]
MSDSKLTSYGNQLDKYSFCQPYLGITSSRFVATILTEPEVKEGKSIGGTDYKLSTRFTNVMELIWASIRKHAWVMFHPPPLIEYGRPIGTFETGSQRIKPVPD